MPGRESVGRGRPFHPTEKLLTRLRRVAFLGNSLPRRCGIATFTTDLQQAVAATGATSETAIVAMTDDDRTYDYPATVRLQVHDQKVEEYERAARFLNTEQFERLVPAARVRNIWWRGR